MDVQARGGAPTGGKCHSFAFVCERLDWFTLGKVTHL